MNKEISDKKRINNFINSLPSDVIQQTSIVHCNQFTDDILPFDIYLNTRQNIERVADQINKSYQYGIYDGCSILMRRLVEMLLILSFKEHKVEEEIRGSDGNYNNLSGLIDKAVSNTTLDLSRNSKEYLALFKDKGNLSAHNPFYNARKRDIELIQPKFRSLIEELLYKSGIIK